MCFLSNKHHRPDEIRRENITWAFPGIKFSAPRQTLTRTGRRVKKTLS